MQVTLSENILEGEKYLRTMHLARDFNSGTGIKGKVRVYLNGLNLNPTTVIDEKEIVKVV